MDQSKWALPRLRHGILTKSMQKLERPRVKVQGVWAANVSLTLNIVDVRQSSDATMVVEALARTLERVAGICSDLGKKMPSKVLVWVSCTNFRIVLSFQFGRFI